jgi:hypothetical protein
VPYVADKSLESLFGDEWLDDYCRRVVRRVGELLLQLAESFTPVAEDPFGDRKRRPGTLRDSWRLGEIEHKGATWRVDVASFDEVAKWVEFPTAPHVIRPRAGVALRFRGAGGKTVYARVVHHPGTAGQRMMGKAIANVSQSWERIAREELEHVGR